MRGKQRMIEKNPGVSRPDLDWQMSLCEHVTLWLSLLVLPRICALLRSQDPQLDPPPSLLVGDVTRFWPIGCDRSIEHQSAVVMRGGGVFSIVPWKTLMAPKGRGHETRRVWVLERPITQKAVCQPGISNLRLYREENQLLLC